MRGRVSAINSLFIGLSNELGDAESGFAAAFFITTLGMGTKDFAALFDVLATMSGRDRSSS